MRKYIPSWDFFWTLVMVALVVVNYMVWAIGPEDEDLYALTIAGFFWLYLNCEMWFKRLMKARVPGKINVFLTKDEYEKMMLVHKEQTLTHADE